MTRNESCYKYRRLIQEYRDYLIYMSLSRRIRENDILYKEYVKMLEKYEECFDLNDL